MILLVGEWTILAPDKDGKTSETGVRATEILLESGSGWRYLLDHASYVPAPPAH
jgi:ketosteroid isomerase-like protein